MQCTSLARLAWDSQSQNYPSNIWLPNTPAPPQSPMQGCQPQSLQYQSPPPPFTGPPPFMNQGPPINQGLMNQPPTYFNQGPVMNQPSAMQNMGFPPPQNNVMQSGFNQPNFMNPPPVNQGYGAPNLPVSHSLFLKCFGLTLLIEIIFKLFMDFKESLQCTSVKFLFQQ